MPDVQKRLTDFRTEGTSTIKVTSVGRVFAPQCECEEGEARLGILGEMWLPESLLCTTEGRAASVQGMFVGSTTRTSPLLFGSTIANANVDWTAQGKRGSLRRATVTVDGVAAISKGRAQQLLHRHEALGEFFCRPAGDCSCRARDFARGSASVVANVHLQSPRFWQTSESRRRHAPPFLDSYLRRTCPRQRPAKCCRSVLNWHLARGHLRAEITACRTRRSCSPRRRLRFGSKTARSSHRSRHGAARS